MEVEVGLRDIRSRFIPRVDPIVKKRSERIVKFAAHELKFGIKVEKEKVSPSFWKT